MVKRRNHFRFCACSVALALVSSALASCGAADDSAALPSIGGDGDAGNGDGDSASGSGGVTFGAGGTSGLPEEIEDETNYRAPVATGRYLWSANPETGRVALIDVVEHSTRVLSAGLFPTYLTSVGADDEPAALVINTGSSDVTRFRATASKVTVDSVPIHVGANQWSTSASGNWAVAWSRAERGRTLDPTEGLQELTVLSLSDELVATRLTVGYRPNQVLISEDDERLIVVSEEGITLIDLTDEPTQSEWINLGFDAAERDVSINPEGTIALVRRTGQSTVDLIDLLEPDLPKQLVFSAPITDLDLAPSGRAVAVVRSNSEVVTFTLDDVVDDQTALHSVTINGEIFGSAALTADGNTAVVYTNALENERVSIVDFRPNTFLSYRSFNTQAPVYSVITSPDGRHATVLAAAPGQALGDSGRPGEAFSLIALRQQLFPRVVGTSAPVAHVALGNTFGIVTASSDVSGVHEAYLLEMRGLSASMERLATRPLSVGVLSDLGLAYAAQAHSEGRVTFFDFEAGQVRTLTGFELSAEVVDR